MSTQRVTVRLDESALAQLTQSASACSVTWTGLVQAMVEEVCSNSGLLTQVCRRAQLIDASRRQRGDSGD